MAHLSGSRPDSARGETMFESKSAEVIHPDSNPYPDERIHLGRIARSLRQSWFVIAVSLLGAVLLFAILATLLLLRQPEQRIVTLPFRLEFQGAEKGEYPNGLRFSAAEIVATPILMRVYSANGVQRFISFKEFSESLFVVESNQALEQLSREYSAKLGDSRLSAVDRERLEGEFRQKRESLSRSEYALTWASDQTALPKTMITKSLNDTLVAWSEAAAKEKGVLKYQLPVVSGNVLRRDVLGSSDWVIALDVLRTRVDTIERNIARLEEVPGASVLRGGPENVSLEEIQLGLADIVRFRLEPLLLQLRSSNATSNPQATVRFIESQLGYNQRQAEAARHRADALRNTLEMYTMQTEQPRTSMPASPRPSGGGDTVMPQLGDSFLDRLIDLTNQRNDIEYRQELVDEIKDASLAVLPYEQEVAYYQQLLSQMRGIGSSTQDSNTAVRQEMNSILESVEHAIRDANAIYDLMSLNLNPSTVLYSVTSPPIARIERGLSLKRIALWGILVFLISIPVILGGVLLAARIREDEALDKMEYEALHEHEGRKSGEAHGDLT
jgi:hypothetical protein